VEEENSNNLEEAKRKKRATASTSFKAFFAPSFSISESASGIDR